MVMSGHIGLYMGMCVHVWSCMVLYGHKLSQKGRQSENEDDLKNEYNLKCEDDLKNEDEFQK